MEHTFTTAARRAQIVRAAVDTIAEVGYAKASFARITERAGLSSPRMISYHFADKDDLIRQIVVDVLGDAAAAMADRMAAESTAVGRLRAYLAANLEYVAEHPREMAALTAIGRHLRTDSGAAYTTATAQEPGVASLETLLDKGKADGEFRDFHTRSMAVIIRGAIEAAAARMRAEPPLDVAAYRAELVTTITLAAHA